MKLIFAISLLLFGIVDKIFAVENELHFISDTQKNGNLRWNVPSNYWRDETYLAKGEYISVVSRTPKSDSYEWKVYDNKDFKGEPSFLFSSEKIKFSNGSYCDDKIPFIVSNNPLLICSFSNCSVVKNTSLEFQESTPFKSRWSLYSKEGKFSDFCHEADNFIYGALKIEEGEPITPTLNFRSDLILIEKGYAVLEIKGKDYYLDLRACREHTNWCETKTFKNSRYENDLLKNEEIKKNKNNELLNQLITNLLPCVKSKDRKCIQSYFVTADEIRSSKIFSLPAIVATIDDEIISELDACLSYEKLLPHNLGTKGINKVCMFNNWVDIKTKPTSGSTKLFGVVFPEGVWTDGYRKRNPIVRRLK